MTQQKSALLIIPSNLSMDQDKTNKKNVGNHPEHKSLQIGLANMLVKVSYLTHEHDRKPVF